jgi:hypothetical protein
MSLLDICWGSSRQGKSAGDRPDRENRLGSVQRPTRACFSQLTVCSIPGGAQPRAATGNEWEFDATLLALSLQNLVA